VNTRADRERHRSEAFGDDDLAVRAGVARQVDRPHVMESEEAAPPSPHAASCGAGAAVCDPAAQRLK
jgi:hypothetical protein